MKYQSQSKEDKVHSKEIRNEPLPEPNIINGDLHEENSGENFYIRDAVIHPVIQLGDDDTVLIQQQNPIGVEYMRSNPTYDFWDKNDQMSLKNHHYSETTDMDVPSTNAEVLANAFAQGLKDEDFFRSLAKQPAVNFNNLLERAEKYVNLEEATHAKLASGMCTT
ncbi:hypothetical protein BUALT_Bualt02G0232500 [Buddleja alternifolia]|uniref:Catalase n=1 Tax=Buddleja alternifolia TaxID=168488 RepID=A0AAV6YDA6_9LAMI|nr:hypothetical protein BUALT_Bualt02G0232500 [Buddleja alternifolia]